MGWDVDLTSISVAEENLFYNYDETTPASVEFLLSNQLRNAANNGVQFFCSIQWLYIPLSCIAPWRHPVNGR